MDVVGPVGQHAGVDGGRAGVGVGRRRGQRAGAAHDRPPSVMPLAGSCTKSTEIVVLLPFVLTATASGVVLLPSIYADGAAEPIDRGALPR